MNEDEIIGHNQLIVGHHRCVYRQWTNRALMIVIVSKKHDSFKGHGRP